MSDTRTHLVRSTSQLIRRGGYTGTPVSEMLRAAGVPKGSLYHYFRGGKEELGVAAIERSGRAVGRAIDHVIAEGDGDLGRAFARMAAVLARNLESSGWMDGCPVATVALEDSVQSEAIGAACRRVLDGWIEQLADAYVARGFARQAAREEAAFVVSAFEGALIVARVQRDARPLYVAAERLSELLSRTVSAARNS